MCPSLSRMATLGCKEQSHAANLPTPNPNPVQMVVVPKDYFWAQCKVPNAGSALLMMVAILAVAGIPRNMLV